ncbi:MAG TPA: hypothetical protein EYH11_03790 [Sulfurimonas autotrophica]|nr:hypothetical protein [Sulfurimonas autotrophica]
MKTRFTSLVHVKKNMVQKSERIVQQANENCKKAQEALRGSLSDLQNITLASHGKIAQLLANRTLIEAQRSMIQHNKDWLEYANSELKAAKEQLKKDMIEYEKYKYLEYEEIQKALKKMKIQESRDLDEVALMTHTNKNKESS